MSVGGSPPKSTWVTALAAMAAMNESGLGGAWAPMVPPLLATPRYTQSARTDSLRMGEERDRLILLQQEADPPPPRNSLKQRIRERFNAMLVLLHIQPAPDIIGRRDSISSESTTATNGFERET